MALKDKPAIVGSEFIKQSSAYLHFTGDILTPEYIHVLNEQFEAGEKNEGKNLPRSS